MMKDRWKETNPDDKIRTLWDLALVEAYLNRDLTELISVNTPPENFKRKINVFIKIDVHAMKDDFWKSMKII